MRKVNEPLKLDSVLIHRREDCMHYDICLEEASALMWQSFSCKGCEHFSKKTFEPVSYERAVSPLAWEV